MLSAATELERRVIRGRQIVGRQRELAAKLGEDLPIAIALLEIYERSLALLENAYARRDVLADTADEAVRAPGAFLVANCPCPAGTTGPGQDHQERMLAVALVIEILREGGYHCELAKETMH
jgi:hypothetical protein